MEIVWIMFHIEWVGVSFDHSELFSCSWKVVGSSQSFRTSCSDRWGTSLLLWCTRSNYGNFRNCYFIRWDALLLFRCMVPCWSIHTTVVPQSITVNNFRFSSWSQLNSVNQIIDSFGDDIGNLPIAGTARESSWVCSWKYATHVKQNETAIWPTARTPAISSWTSCVAIQSSEKEGPNSKDAMPTYLHSWLQCEVARLLACQTLGLLAFLALFPASF